MGGLAGYIRADASGLPNHTQTHLQDLLRHRGTAPPAEFSKHGVHLLAAKHAQASPYAASNAGMAAVADGHIDNADDIRLSLDLPPEVGLAEMLLAAFRAWGRSCAQYLLGEFAFAIVTDCGKRIFLCRDQIGVKPLYFYHDGSNLAFASESGIVADLLERIAGIPRRLDDRALAMLLASGHREHGTTCFAGIESVPPATTILIESRRVLRETYWHLDPALVLRCKSDAEYDAVFKATFEDSLRDRMRRTGRKAATLSGGLDSSTIALVAARSEPALRVYSTRWPASPDGPFIEAVLKAGVFTPTNFDAAASSPLRAAEFAVDEPVANVNWYSVTNMFAAAEADGVTTMLSGFGADEVVGYGFERLVLLARRGDWAAFDKETAALSRTFDVSQSGYFHMFGGPALLQAARAGHWMTFARHLRGALQHLRGSPRSLLGAAGMPVTRDSFRNLFWRGAPRAQGASLVPPYLNAEFMRQTDLHDRLRAEKAGGLPEAGDLRRYQAEAFCDAAQISHTLESYDLTAARFRLEQTYPFLDRRMVELCFALPFETKLADGWTRMILRRSMKDVLPDQVRWRADKGNDSMGAKLALLMSKETLDTLILSDPEPIAPYFDIDAVRAAYGRYLASPEEASATDLFGVFQAASTSIWLKRMDFDSRVSAP